MNFFSFFAKMLSGDTGPSSKRGLMYILLILFILQHQVDTWTGKHPSPNFSDQLFELLCLAIIVVFGEKFLPVLMQLRGKKPDEPTKPAA